MSQSITKWLYFGLHIKRWLLLLLFGVVIMGLGFAYLLREVYVSYVFPEWTYWATLQFIPRWGRGAMFVSVAAFLTIYAGWRLNRSITEAVLPAEQRDDLIEQIYLRRTQERGPKIVAIGGGTGLSNLLSSLKQYTSNLTAIVTVADDGGSSGKLREHMQVLPPGDIRNCIAAMAEAEPLVTELFQYRFDEDAGDGIAGHSFGNLFIVAMSEVVGNMERAIAETSRVLNVRGRIFPSTLANVTLGAQLADGAVVRGESQIAHSGTPPERVFIDPPDVPAHPQAVHALLDADLILIGPGSLYTSVLPNLLVGGIGEALLASHGYKVYISNVATEHGETDGYSAADHYTALRRHLDGKPLVDAVLANSDASSAAFAEEWRSQPVAAEGDADYGGARLVLADVVDGSFPLRHDSERLARAIMRAYFERDLIRVAEPLPAPAAAMVAGQR